ncbi:integrase/recombinase xerD homolog [Engraulis encrasicolus]|uniref:integrase/recombinase xerD homolog n=1 Tax=Engraulis encrasicolus TaxID=184585 RepID=UPI002FD28E32
MARSLAKSTLKCYASAWSMFTTFCSAYLLSPLPAQVSTICAFIVYCFDTRHLQPASIHKLLSGVQFYARINNPDTQSFFSNPSIKLLLKGIAKSCPTSPDSRLPITLPILHQLVSTVRRGYISPYLDKLLETVFLTAFYGFMRCGEFTSPSPLFNPSVDLTLSDLTFSPSHFSIFLKHSKSDSLCHGTTVYISKLHGVFCPFSSMVEFIKLRHDRSLSSPLFLLPDGAPMCRQWFCCHLAAVLRRCNLPPAKYTAHSFRIGAATTAAHRGISTSAIKLLGRWSSEAYASYIRPSRHQVLDAQRAIAST